MHSRKILKVFPSHTHLQARLSKELGILPIVAQVLINRGLTTPSQASEFLHAKLKNLFDPFDFSGMDQAVSLIRKALRQKEKIASIGDYDVDGITALAVIKDSFSGMGLDIEHYLPHRLKEGYGLNKNLVQWAKDKKVKLLITADCGINSHEAIEELRRQHIEVIVTDHHEPSGCAAVPASAVINPKVESSGYHYRDLAGVGVAFKLCQAVTGKFLEDSLDLVTLGTIADVVPLTGENRIMVKEGLLRLTKSKRAGIKALFESSRMKAKMINSRDVSFILGPRINASGRMDSAEASLKLLMSKNADEAGALAKIIEGYNQQRQKIEKKIMAEAQDLINHEVNFKKHKVIVVVKQDWHRGVLGIVASKLADKFYRPTILISAGESSCKGSGRSIKGFDLFHALCDCGDLLENFGGHSHAVGLVIARGSIERFKDKINAYAAQTLMLEDLLPTIEVDMEVKLSDLNQKMVVALEALEPFGAANPEPQFFSRNLTLKGQPQLLSRATLKFWVSDGVFTLPAIGFGMGAFEEQVKSASHIDLVFTPRMDTWGGNNAVILEIKEVFCR